jgi:hypothetical protein
MHISQVWRSIIRQHGFACVAVEVVEGLLDVPVCEFGLDQRPDMGHTISTIFVEGCANVMM